MDSATADAMKGRTVRAVEWTMGYEPDDMVTDTITIHFDEGLVVEIEALRPIEVRGRRERTGARPR